MKLLINKLSGKKVHILSLILILNILIPVGFAQNNSNKNNLSSPFIYVKKHIRGQNNYLAALHNLENAEEKYLASPLKGLYLDYMSYLHGWVGNHDESYKYEDKFLSTLKHIQDKRKIKRKDILKSPLEKFKRIDAVSAIDEVAKKHQVIMINEEHRTPRHRAFTLQILSKLYQRGFRYFAAETINSVDKELNERGYPIQTSGFYTADPLYGDMIRTALKLGYKIIPYEYEEKCERLPDKPFECQEKREKGQAQNLQDRILKTNPKAKILVHVGRGHNAKAKTPYFSFMAKHFQEITQITPFTIDQLQFSERYNYLDEPVLYNFLKKQNTLKNSSVFQASNGSFYGSNEAYDMYIFHPKTFHKDGRPTWLEMNGLRKPQKINFKKLKLKQKKKTFEYKEPILIQAFYSNESADAVPIDQIILYPKKEVSNLILPKGNFNIRAIDKLGKVLGKYSQNVEK